MTESIDAGRVAVYIDFDNVVISRYDQLHGQGAWRRDRARDASPAVLEKLAAARIDVGEIVDFASSFGTVALTRAYADWSVPANAAYRGQLVDRAVDLTQSSLRRGRRTAPTFGSPSTSWRISSGCRTSTTW